MLSFRVIYTLVIEIDAQDHKFAAVGANVGGVHRLLNPMMLRTPNCERIFYFFQSRRLADPGITWKGMLSKRNPGELFFSPVVAGSYPLYLAMFLIEEQTAFASSLSHCN